MPNQGTKRGGHREQGGIDRGTKGSGNRIKGRTTESTGSTEGLVAGTGAAGTEVARAAVRLRVGVRGDKKSRGDTSRPAEDSDVLASDRIVKCARRIAAVGSGEHRAIGLEEKTADFVRGLLDARVSLRSFWVLGTRQNSSTGMVRFIADPATVALAPRASRRPRTGDSGQRSSPGESRRVVVCAGCARVGISPRLQGRLRHRRTGHGFPMT